MLLASLFLQACAPMGASTDQGQALVGDASLHDYVADDGTLAPLVTGTSVCPTAYTPDGTDATDCYTILDGENGAELSSGNCRSWSTTGSYTLDLEPVDCDLRTDEQPLGADTLTVEIVAADELSGQVDWYYERMAEAGVEGGYAQCDVASLAVPAAGDVVRVVDGETVSLFLHVADADGRAVGWSSGELSSSGLSSASFVDGRVEVTAAGSDDSTISLTLDGTAVPLVKIRPVPLSDVATVKVVAAVELLDDGTSVPLGFRAVTRDNDDHVIFGAPVEWRFSAYALSVGTDDGTPGKDYAFSNEECTDPGETFGEQTATITASLDVFRSDSETVTWTPRLTAAPDADWTQPEECQTACGCASASAGLGVIPLVLGAALARRRRR